MRGRKPKPTERQIAEGDPQKRGVNKLDERILSRPKAAKGLPACPEFLTGAAREAWDFWKLELELMGMDSRPDAPVLTAACIAYQSVVEAYQAKDGRVLDGALKTLRSLSSEFGFTPVSRERLTLEAPDRGEADLAKILAQPRLSKDAVQ